MTHCQPSPRTSGPGRICRSADSKHTLLSLLALEVMRVGGRGAGEAVLSDEMGALSDSMLKVGAVEGVP